VQGEGVQGWFIGTKKLLDNQKMKDNERKAGKPNHFHAKNFVFISFNKPVNCELQ
jgi:hypothetical protein